MITQVLVRARQAAVVPTSAGPIRLYVHLGEHLPVAVTADVPSLDADAFVNKDVRVPSARQPLQRSPIADGRKAHAAIPSPARRARCCCKRLSAAARARYCRSAKACHIRISSARWTMTETVCSTVCSRRSRSAARSSMTRSAAWHRCLIWAPSIIKTYAYPPPGSLVPIHAAVPPDSSERSVKHRSAATPTMAAILRTRESPRRTTVIPFSHAESVVG